jgi:hypothetical protein
MNAAGHSTCCRPEYREPAHDCCLPDASNPELAEFLGVAPRTVVNSIATPRAHGSRQHHPWCFALLPALYTGTKELSYPACRRLEGSAGPARPTSACRAGHSWAACGLVTTSSRPSDGSPFADRPQDSNAGRAAIFRGVVSGSYLLLWSRRRVSTTHGGSRRLTPASGAWLFQYPLLGSISSSARETVLYSFVSLLGSTPRLTRQKDSGKCGNSCRCRFYRCSGGRGAGAVGLAESAQTSRARAVGANCSRGRPLARRPCGPLALLRTATLTRLYSAACTWRHGPTSSQVLW